MTLLAWSIVGLWSLILLASARVALRRLPPPGPWVPPYQVWLPSGGEVPPLEPPPERVVVGPAPGDGPDALLVLGPGVEVAPDLPARLAACEADFVGVFPAPVGGPVALGRERVFRDLAGVEQVTDVRHPAGSADHRCAWIHRADLALPGPGEAPLLRLARARKAHGLPVDLRDGRGAVRANALNSKEFRAELAERTGDGLVRWLLVGLPVGLVLAPVALLFTAAWPVALLALGLGAAARLMTGVRDGFGVGLALLGPLVELGIAVEVATAPSAPPAPRRPVLPEAAPQALTGARSAEAGAWLDAAAVPFLARRLGGAARVMEQLYDNTPAGETARGVGIDRAVHASPGARAVRHRLLMVRETGRALAPRRLLSVPCGGARDAAYIGAPETVLVDPDPTARALAQAACPAAQVLDATLETLPPGPFDVVLFVGLAEYLDDRALHTGLVALRERLAPAGALLVTTTAPHPGLARMRRWLGWDTKGRTPEDLGRVLGAAGFRVESKRADPLEIQWLLVARSTVATPSWGEAPRP